MNSAERYKKNLAMAIISTAAEIQKHVIHPGKDFTRCRKLDLVTFTEIMLSMQGNTLTSELENYFDCSKKTPTKSAFVQQRAKLSYTYFESILHKFNNVCNDNKTYNGYHLLAIDGSDINIARNPDSDTFICPSETDGFNQMHINALYDICNKTYTDCYLQPKTKADERDALIRMLNRNQLNKRSIVVMDRGYESYNVFAYFLEKRNIDFICRVKHGQGSIRALKKIPFKTGNYYVDIDITTTQTNDDKKNNRIFLQTGSKKGKVNSPNTTMSRWDFQSPYKMHLRVCRFMLNCIPDKNGSIIDNPDNYETIVTTLSEKDFPTQEIKKLYHMRWGIETSFRELKYAVGLVNFHAKNENSVKQEIFARLIIYNLCERITGVMVVAQKQPHNHIYQVNFTQAIWFCKRFYAGKISSEMLLQKILQYIEPVRPGRNDKRKFRPKAFVSFLYRVAA